MHIEELNDTNCKTYLLVVGSDAMLVDPVRERLSTYRRVLDDRGLTLRAVLETHTHADHLMLNGEAKELLAAPFIMHEQSPSPLIDRHLREGDVLDLGGERIEVLHTPGHTPDSLVFRVPGAVLTGDTLLINGSGRTDFPGGDAGQQYDAVVSRLFALPDDTIVYPGHDYRGNTRSTIGAEKRNNPRFASKTREQYVELMSNLGLPFPEKIQQSLQVNQSGFEESQVAFPLIADIVAVNTVTASELAKMLASPTPPVVLDVREPEEFVGDLGHIERALLVPMDALAARLPKLAGYVDRELVVVCRAGARSASAAAMLQRAGFSRVANLQGGMLAWSAAGGSVAR